MLNFTPNSKIHIGRVPWDNSYRHTRTFASASAGDVLCANADKSGVGSLSMYGTADSESVVISIGDFNGDEACFVMPDSDVVVVYTS